MSSQLTVVTYNIWGYHTPAEYLKRKGELRGAAAGTPATHLNSPEMVWAKRRAVLTRVLEEADPDVIVLAENGRHPRHPERSHAHQLARNLGMTVLEGAFPSQIDPHLRTYEGGVAILTHLSVDFVQEMPLPFLESERIGGTVNVLQATLDFEGEPLNVWATHLPSKSEEARRLCAKALRDELPRVPHAQSLLLCGDLNAEPDSAPLDILCGDSAPIRFIDCWQALHPEETGFTMPTPEPTRRIDYVLLKDPPNILKPSSAEIIGDTPNEEGFFSSDHCGLKVAFTCR